MTFENIHELKHLFTAIMLVGMPCMMEIGRRVALSNKREIDKASERGITALDTAVYGLFGLLLAFTFHGAAERFDYRRGLMAQEANFIGTSYLRIDLLPPDSQSVLRPLFPQYIDARLESFRRIDNLETEKAALEKVEEIQQQIWREANAGALRTGNPGIISLTASGLNEMIDITTTQYAATRTHPPIVIYYTLVLLGLSTAFLAGSSMAKSKSRQWTHIVIFTLVMSGAVFVIIDVEYPRQGLFTIEGFDQLFIDLQKKMQ